MDDTLKNLANVITSDATNLTNLTMANDNLTKQLNETLAQNKFLTDLLIKNICGVAATKSENQNENKQQCTDKTRGRENEKIT